jgi:organic hydroperoxide reductase OsmC/OhrA
VSLTTPRELGGPGGHGANPEKLLAAGYAACCLGAMKFVASHGGPKMPSDAMVTASSQTCQLMYVRFFVRFASISGCKSGL